MYLPPLLFVSRLIDISEDVGQDPISPVPSVRVQNTVKFNNTHGFRVKWEHLGLQSQSERKAEMLMSFKDQKNDRGAARRH